MWIFDRWLGRRDVDRDASVQHTILDLLLAIDMEIAFAAEHGGDQGTAARPAAPLPHRQTPAGRACPVFSAGCRVTWVNRMVASLSLLEARLVHNILFLVI